MKILIVDDDASSRLISQATVNKLGHQCFVATDGAEALEVFKSTDPHVVITDWLMPGIDGLELCRRIRQMSADSYTYVILLTTLTDHEHAIAAMRAGADDHMPKPLSREELQERLIVAARHSESRTHDQETSSALDHRLRVLVADDDAVTREMLTALINSESSLELVGTAYSTKDAISLAVREEPDVAILDWDMPGGGGGIAAATIREQAPATRVVALSGSKHQEASFDMLRSGARNFLTKGVSKDTLVNSIRAAAQS